MTTIPPPRIRPLDPPFAPEVGARLTAMMGGADLPPLALFRTLLRNLPMSRAMARWGAYVLGSSSTLDVRTRELVITRVCARCDCEYEWGVHASIFGRAAGLSRADLAATTAPGVAPTWSAADGDVIRLVDELHDTGHVSDACWDRLRVRWSEEQLLELVVLAGWYHAIAYVANAARLPLEPWATRFSTASEGSES